MLQNNISHITHFKSLTHPADEERYLKGGSAHYNSGFSKFDYFKERRSCVEPLVELIVTSVRGNRLS